MSHRILIVEDERIVALDLMATVARMGHEVVGSAASGRQALELARGNRPDCVLMDIMLDGDMDGIETTCRLKGMEDVPVIYVTAYSDDETRSRAAATRPCGFLVKPVHEAQLRQAIDEAMTRRQDEA